MAKAKKVSVADTRKPKHPLDANRPSKGGKNQRDAATVGAQTCLSSRGAAVRGRPGRRGPSAAGARRAGAAAQHVQEDGDARQAREDPAPGAPRSACPAMPAPAAEQRVPDVAHPRSQDLQSKELPNTRIQPNRGWFQNSRVTDQKALERFREEMSTKARSYGALAPGGAGLPGGQCESTCRLVQELWSVPRERVPLGSGAVACTQALLLHTCKGHGAAPRQPPPPTGGGAPAQVNDAYTVLLREKKLPMALLEDPEAKAAAAGKAARASLVQTQPFAATFGAKRTRKRPKLAADSLADLAASALRVNATCARADRASLTRPPRRGAGPGQRAGCVSAHRLHPALLPKCLGGARGRAREV